MDKDFNYLDILLNLDPGSEVNIDIGNKTFYNASFWKVNPKRRVAYFFIDQFYEQGSTLTPISIDEIDHVDLPVTVKSYKNPQGVLEEDE